MKLKLLILFVMLFCFTNSNAQSNWSVRGNSANDTDFVGTINAKNLMFKANNLSSFKVKPNGRINFMYSAKIDSVLDVDSIHARVIRVGNNSMILGGVYSTTTDDITSTNSAISFGGDLSVTTFDNIQLMIGTHTAQQKLHISDGNSNAVRMQYTNSGTGTTSSDGFQIGILGGGSNGHAVFNQQENLPMLFNTNATERMRILGGGNIGINTTAPTNKLEITEGTSGNSGLTFTNLPNTLTGAMPNPTTRVLSVDNQGKVIMVDDNVGSGGGSVNYCAGVSNDFLMKRETSGNLCISGVYEIPSGFGTLTNNIGIGTGLNNALKGKLNVVGNAKIGSTYAGNTIVAPADGALIEGNVGIGRTNANAQNTVDARLHIDITNTGPPNPVRRNFFFGTARDRSISGLNEQAFRMFTEGGLNGNSDAVYQAVGMGTGKFDAINTSNTGARLTSNVGGSNTAGIEPINTTGNRLALGGDTIYPNTTNTGSLCYMKGPVFGDFSHQWGRIWSHEIRQAENSNRIFMRLRPGYTRDDSRYDAALVIQATKQFTTATYLKIIGTPSTFNTCENTYDGGSLFSTITPVFEVGAHGVGIGGFMPTGLNGLWVDGDITVTGFYLPSDERIKKNVQDYTTGLDALRNVNVKTYQYKNKLGITDTTDIKIGVIAQELMQVLPNAVDEFLGKLNNPADTAEADQTILRINQNALLFTAINAIKDLDNKNQELTQAVAQQAQKMEEILQRLDQCCTANHDGSRTGQLPPNETENNGESNSLKVELSNSNKIVLNQNEPNPFKEKTIIKYTIPTDVKQAEIIFFDKNGSIIKSVLIETRGAGQLEVYSSNLSAGTYTYSLVADGISIDTKNMINIK